MTNWNETRVSLFPSARRDQPRDVTMAEIAALVQEPGGLIEELTQRAQGASQGELANLKMHDVPAAAFGGTFAGRSARDLRVPSGLVVLELTQGGRPVPKSPGTLTAAAVLAFDSLTRRGTKVVMAVSPRPASPAGYAAAQRGAASHLRAAVADPGREVTVPEGISRITLLAHDQGAYINPEDPLPVPWELPEPSRRRPGFDQELWTQAVRMAHRESVRNGREPGGLKRRACGLYELLLAGPGPDIEPYAGTPPPGPEEEDL